MPEISVIVPVYKVEKYLYRCIDSIIAQTFTDWECILVDDGSPDNCPAICDEYAKKDDRIKVIHKKNGGLSDARNAGLDIAKGEWITFIDSDDWIHKEYIECLYNACVENGADISVCGYYQTEGNEPEIQKEKFIIKLYSPEKLWVENRINATIACAKLYKNTLWSGIRFPVGKIHEDEYTTYRLLFKCDKIAYMEAEMYFYFTNPNGIMRSDWSPKRLDAVEAFNQQLKFFRKHKFTQAEKVTLKEYEYSIDYNCKQTKNKYAKEYKKLKKAKRRLYIKYKDEYKKQDGWEYLYKEFFPLEIIARSYLIKAINKVKRRFNNG